MKKITGVTFLFLAFFIACEYKDLLYSDEALTNKIEAQLKSESESIDFSKLNDFEWDKLLILKPYSVVKHVQDTLLLDLNNIKENKIEMRESLNLLIFLKERKSVKISEISRSAGEFENFNLMVDKNQAKFFKTEQGRYELKEGMKWSLNHWLKNTPR